MNKGFTPLHFLSKLSRTLFHSMKSGAGFTLLEVLAAMFIMMMGVLGIFGLISRTVAFNSSVSSQFVASYLAQEGLEIARNIRDANFLKVHKGLILPNQWNDGLTACTAGCGADYNDLILGSLQDTPLGLSNGFYAYGAGTDTIFKRKIIIDSATADILKVSVDVSWSDKGNIRHVLGATELYNWLTPTE